MTQEQYKLVGRKAAGKREKDDFYPTPEYMTEALLSNWKFDGTVWECACGDGRMSEVLKHYRYRVVSTDLIDRGYYDRTPAAVDFLLENTRMDNIVTNPPFSLAYEFMEQGLRLADKCLALLLPVRYLTGKSRAVLYKKNPPRKIIVIPNKVDFIGNGNPVMEFAWFIWDKEDASGKTELVWAEGK